MTALDARNTASLSDARNTTRGLLLQAYDSVVPPHSAIYCSAPITSGRRYVEWLSRQAGSRLPIDELSDADRALHRRHVVEPNTAHARQVADRLRQRTGKPVIDPTAIRPIAGWRQADWVSFWEEVIERFSFEVVLIDGWEYSYGCSHEFWFALTRRVPTLDEAGKPLSASQGSHRLKVAIADLKQAGGDTSELDRVLDSLRGLSS